VRLLTFREYVGLRDGLMLPDKPPAAGMPRLNPFPATWARLRSTLARSPGPAPAPRRRPGNAIDYRAAVRHGLLP
jgi:hypothetical protein